MSGQQPNPAGGFEVTNPWAVHNAVPAAPQQPAPAPQQQAFRPFRKPLIRRAPGHGPFAKAAPATPDVPQQTPPSFAPHPSPSPAFQQQNSAINPGFPHSGTNFSTQFGGGAGFNSNTFPGGPPSVGAFGGGGNSAGFSGGSGSSSLSSHIPAQTGQSAAGGAEYRITATFQPDPTVVFNPSIVPSGSSHAAGAGSFQSSFEQSAGSSGAPAGGLTTISAKNVGRDCIDSFVRAVQHGAAAQWEPKPNGAFFVRLSGGAEFPGAANNGRFSGTTVCYYSTTGTALFQGKAAESAHTAFQQFVTQQGGLMGDLQGHQRGGPPQFPQQGGHIFHDTPMPGAQRGSLSGGSSGGTSQQPMDTSASGGAPGAPPAPYGRTSTSNDVSMERSFEQPPAGGHHLHQRVVDESEIELDVDAARRFAAASVGSIQEYHQALNSSRGTQIELDVSEVLEQAASQGKDPQQTREELYTDIMQQYERQQMPILDRLVAAFGDFLRTDHVQRLRNRAENGLPPLRYEMGKDDSTGVKFELAGGVIPSLDWLQHEPCEVDLKAIKKLRDAPGVQGGGGAASSSAAEGTLVEAPVDCGGHTALVPVDSVPPEKVPFPFSFEGLAVQFHYEKILPPQQLVIFATGKAIKYRKHAVLESPTGTGKTAALLCSAIEAQRHISLQVGAHPQIIYGTRTQGQVKQVIKELKKSPYRPSVIALGSRQKGLCVNTKVLEQPGDARTNCNKARKVAERPKAERRKEDVAMWYV